MLARNAVFRTARSIHTVAELPFDKPVGIPGLFSPKGLDIAWFQYQKMLIDKINTLVEKSQVTQYEEAQTLRFLMEETQKSSSPSDRKLSSLASQAYANEFFFRSLGPENRNKNAKIGYNPANDRIVDLSSTTTLPEEDSLDQPLKSLYRGINACFDSPDQLKELLVSRANAMFGNGYVWLISSEENLSVVNTYNWATPHASRDTNETDGASTTFNLTHRIQSFQPLLAINAWQHAYLHDYGLKGKRDYLNNVFDTINWDLVAKRNSPESIGFKTRA